MTSENEQFLKQNLHHFITLERAFYLRGLNVHERGGMEVTMRECFAPDYRCDLTCPTCVADMVRLLYRSYFNYLKAKHCDGTIYKDISEGIEQLMNKEISAPACDTDTTQKLPEGESNLFKVHASFPSNLPDIRDLLFYQLEKQI